MLVDQAKVLAEVETGVMDKATAEVLVARNAKVAVKIKALAKARDVVEVWAIEIEQILVNAKIWKECLTWQKGVAKYKRRNKFCLQTILSYTKIFEGMSL